MQLWITARDVIIHYRTTSAATKFMYVMQWGVSICTIWFDKKKKHTHTYTQTGCLRKYTGITVTMINLIEIFTLCFFKGWASHKGSYKTF